MIGMPPKTLYSIKMARVSYVHYSFSTLKISCNTFCLSIGEKQNANTDMTNIIYMYFIGEIRYEKGQADYIAPLRPRTLASVKTWGIPGELVV